MSRYGTGVAEGSVGLELAFLVGNFAGCLVRDGLGQGESDPCGLGLESIALHVLVSRRE